MIDIQALIQSSRAALQQLKNGTHDIILRTTPTTWEGLREELQTQLVPILYKLYEPLGGLHVIPTVELPDGVTSTSLVSQSEMTQFVTNTLNVWFADLMERLANVGNNSVNRFKPNISLRVRRSLYTLPAVEMPVIEITKPVITITKPIPIVYTVSVDMPVIDITKPAITIAKATP